MQEYESAHNSQNAQCHGVGMEEGRRSGVLRGRMFNKLCYRKVTVTFTCTFTFISHNSDAWELSKLKVDWDAIKTIFIKYRSAEFGKHFHSLILHRLRLCPIQVTDILKYQVLKLNQVL